MMDVEVKERWVKALRSGDYKQGDGALHNYDSNCYCCLGVLTVVEGVQPLDLDKVDEDPYSGFGPYTIFDFGDGNSQTEEVPVGWNGIDNHTLNTLISMNDTQKKSFNEIADYIEENL